MDQNCLLMHILRGFTLTFHGRTLIATIILLVIGFSTTSRSLAAEKSTNRPNILLIVVDDMGYSDIGPFGGEIDTPNLDALAKSGVLFTDFHTSASCSPTRSMLLSGTDNHLAGLGSMGELIKPNQKGKPGYEGFLNQRVVSIATLLRDAGYFTCMSGKWHLGEELPQGPSHRGFQKAYTMLQGGTSHFDDEWMMYANYTPVYRENGRRVHVPKGFYSSEFYTSKLISYLDSRPVDQPFFGYLSFTAPHDPLHAPDEWIEKYKGKYDAGYDALRQSRLQRLKEIGFVDPDAISFPRLATISSWEKLTDKEKKVEARKMEVYAAMIANLDHHLGRLFRHLKKTGEWENTQVIFFSDNGANGHEMDSYPQTDKAWVERNSDNRFENMGRQYSRIATGPAWAQVSMTPFRMFKGFVSEGGIRSPLIMKSPGMAKAGTRSDAFSHVMDIAATILDASKTTHPGTSYKGRKTEELRGKSLLPVLSGKASVVHKDDTAVSWELFGFRAVRKGDFKLLWLPKPFGKGDWQLYDLSKDQVN
ncbi:MAG: arylsulfatase A-like enzyme [Pirellulaceae bacterium]|jgi:arylsulfatase A-like enzyme